MTTLTPELCRAARGLLAWGQRDLAKRAGVSHPTIAAFELGERRPYERTLRDLRAAFEAGGVLFIAPVAGEHAGGVALREGVEPGKPAGTTTPAAKGERLGEGGQAAAWEDWELEAIAAEPDVIPLSEEDRAALAEHYRQRPEAWAALSELSRQALRRAMGIERLG